MTPAEFSLAFLWLCSTLLGVRARLPCPTYMTPTTNLRDAVIAQCTMFQEIVNPQQFCKNDMFRARDCVAVWKAFSRAFRDQPRCNVSHERFSDYIELTDHSVPKDKGILWSGVYTFVARFVNNGAKYVNIGNTLPGHTLDGLQFCVDSDLNMVSAPTQCPWDTPACQNAYRAFWIAASQNFARKLRGHVHILLNGTREPIFRSTNSYLAMYELPNLSAKKVTVLILNENQKKNRDICSIDESIRDLETKLKDKGIAYECVENREDVKTLFCLDNPEAKIC